MSSVLQSSPLKPNTTEQWPHRSPRAQEIGATAASKPHSTGPPVPPARLWSNAHPFCGCGMFVRHCETTTCSASTRCCWIHVSSAEKAAAHRSEEQAGTGRKGSAVSPPAALIHTPQECFSPLVFSITSLYNSIHMINSGTQVPALAPGSSTPEHSGSRLNTAIPTRLQPGLVCYQSYKGES